MSNFEFKSFNGSIIDNSQIETFNETAEKKQICFLIF